MIHRTFATSPAVRLTLAIFMTLVFLFQALPASATPIYISNTPSMYWPKVLAGNHLTGRVYLGRSTTFPQGDIKVINDLTGDIIDSIPVPYVPQAMAINETTNTIYVVCWAPTNTMYIVNGTTDAVTEVIASSTEFYRLDAAVNELTNKVYLTGYMWTPEAVNNYLSILDGESLTYVTPTIEIGTGNNSYPKIAVMESKNKIYIPADDGVKVISGSTDEVITTIPVGSYPKDLLVDEVHQLVYVVNQNSNNVSVINGATDSVISTIPVGSAPTAIAFNSVTNKLYTANSGDGTVSVIDGSLGTTHAISVGGTPSIVRIDAAINEVFVGSGTHLKVINGLTETVYEPDLVYQPDHAYYNIQDITVMPSHKAYIADRHNYDDYGWWTVLADIDLAASIVEATPLTLPIDGPSTISVTVSLKDSLGSAVPGVAVWLSSSGTENTFIGSGYKTFSNGQVTSQFWSSKPEEKTVTATLSEGKSLEDTATVTFTSPPPTSIIVTPATPGTATYLDEHGFATSILIPVGSVTSPTVIQFTPLASPTHSFPFFGFAGHAFALTAYQNGALVPNLQFLRPIGITIWYSDEDVEGLEEGSISLRYWNGSAWSDDGLSVYHRDLQNNYIVMNTSHLSEFALFGDEDFLETFLPFIIRK